MSGPELLAREPHESLEVALPERLGGGEVAGLQAPSQCVMEPWLSVTIGPPILIITIELAGAQRRVRFFSEGCPAGGSLAVRRMSGRGLTRL